MAGTAAQTAARQANVAKAWPASHAAKQAAAAARLELGLKRCARCAMVKELDAFSPRAGLDGRDSYCRRCRADLTAEGKRLRREAAEARREIARQAGSEVRGEILQRLAARSRIAATCCGGPLIWHPEFNWWRVGHKPGCSSRWQPWAPDDADDGDPVADRFCALCGEVVPDDRQAPAMYCSRRCGIRAGSRAAYERLRAARSQQPA